MSTRSCSRAAREGALTRLLPIRLSRDRAERGSLSARAEAVGGTKFTSFPLDGATELACKSAVLNLLRVRVEAEGDDEEAAGGDADTDDEDAVDDAVGEKCDEEEEDDEEDEKDDEVEDEEEEEEDEDDVEEEDDEAGDDEEEEDDEGVE